MSKYFICCEHCYYALERINNDAAKLWMSLCQDRMNYGKILSFGPCEPSGLCELETFGFISTAENLSGIKVKVHGPEIDSKGEYFFCCKGGNHDE